MTDDFDELQNLAREFKADLSVFLQRNRRYAMMIVLFMNLSFGQVAIVAAGNQTETIGEVFPIMQTIQREEVSLGVPNFEIPIEPKKEVIKKKTFIQKLMEFFRKLINKK